MKDLIIGGASNYTWDHLKYWVNSIKRSGFKGDTVLVATNISKETIEKLNSEGVLLELYGAQQPDGSFKAHSTGAPHVERFFYIWNYLKNNQHKYRFAITTDTRDVVFQFDPTVWLSTNMTRDGKLVISSEGMKYEDEPWGNQNLLQAFGPYFHNLYKSSTIYNVGVLAGEVGYVTDLLFMIFQMSINRPIPVVDQAVFNVIMQQKPWTAVTVKARHTDAWAAQLGTTIQAVRSGAGDIGAQVAQDPSALILYQAKYLESQPDIDESGYVVNSMGDRFFIVHQYDRCGYWKDKIMERYDD